MNQPNPNITPDRRPIRQLDETAINRIAAGEVVERPASAIKELVENALDAGATRIDVSISDGGLTLIEVEDDGCGIPLDELPLALARHATSKIDGTDLLNIHSFGFRGEALPSLGSVARLEIETREPGADTAWLLQVNGGKIAAPRPAARAVGTRVRVADLFHATPARLKFMRSARAETQAALNTIKLLAMTAPTVAFTVTDRSEGARKIFDVPAETGLPHLAMAARLGRIMGRAFEDNAIWIDTERDGMRLTGMAGLPTFSKGAAVAQYLFVNNRPVRDRMLGGALRAGYMDVMSRDRHPVAALFITCAPERVDVNVHPAKTEVRFREAGIARGLIVSGLRHALAEAGHKSSTTVASGVLGAFQPEQRPVAPVYQMDRPRTHIAPAPVQTMPGFAEAPVSGFVDDVVQEPPIDAPLGAARAQIHENYIIAQTAEGMVLVDQHAAHERLVYEDMKARMGENGVASQALLIPEIVELGAEAAMLLEHAGDLAKMGLELEAFGAGSICVRATPAPLGEVDAQKLVRDICDELTDSGSSTNLEARLNAVLSRMSCHGSIRSGRRMSGPEMDALLRRMEATPLSGQCNHGRPTYVTLSLADIERLFGRT